MISINNDFKNTEEYQKFINENPSIGYLKIKAYSANEAVPISNLKIIVSKVIDSNRVIFFEGSTNESGIIERIELPAPLLNPNNLDAPLSTIYDIDSFYNNVDRKYSVRIFDNVYVVQTINVIPNNIMRGNYGN